MFSNTRGRIKRHDNICNALGAHMRGTGYNVVYEPRLITSVFPRKPDILAIKDDEAFVLDAQVVKGDNMEQDYRKKVGKYSGIPELGRLIVVKYAVTRVHYIAYRGIWCQSSYRALK